VQVAAGVAGALVASLAPTAFPSAAAPRPSPIDPTALARGAAPSVPYLVRDVLRDGDARVSVTKRGTHDALWRATDGYVLRDVNVGADRFVHVVYVSGTGEIRGVARSRGWISVTVSPSGRTIAVQRWIGQTAQRSVITVTRARTGEVVGQRTIRLATLAAVTDHRVLVGLRARWRNPATLWWNLRRDRTRHLYHQAATSADVAHDRVVFNRSTIGEFCNRVAVLSHPARTLWRSCSLVPHEWSPLGDHAVAPPTYFDAAGTNRWWVVDGRTAEREAMLTGRLDWTATWEDDHHFLTLAQSDSGRAAIIRCDSSGDCERASRLWSVPVPADLYYAPPPVVLSTR
jgi:hypothetical protein